MHDRIEVLGRIGDAWQHRREGNVDWNTGFGEHFYRAQALARRCNGRFDIAREPFIKRRDADRDADARDFGETLQYVDIAHDERRARDDAGRRAIVRERLKNSAR